MDNIKKYNREDLKNLSEEELKNLYYDIIDYADIVSKETDLRLWQKDLEDYTGKYVKITPFYPDSPIIYAHIKEQSFFKNIDHISNLSFTGECFEFLNSDEYRRFSFSYEKNKTWTVGDIYSKKELAKRIEVLTKEQYMKIFAIYQEKIKFWFSDNNEKRED